MSRVRTRTVVYQYWQTPVGGLFLYPNHVSTQITEHFIDPRIKPGPCEHLKVKPGTDEHYDSSILERFENVSVPISFVRDTLDRLLQSKLKSLDRSHLPTTNQAGIIQIFAEIDETIALFTMKLWKLLSHGTVVFGIVPFIADLKAIAQTVQNLSANLRNFRYTDQDSISFGETLPDLAYGYFLTDAKCKLRRNGSGDISDVPEISKILDRLGLHPDIATAWDLVPCSFLIDYIFPIGNYLESWRGWVNNMTYTGWGSLTVDGTVTFLRKHSGTTKAATIPLEFTYYRRWRDNQLVLGITPDNQITAKQPSLMQLFNTLYVLKQRIR